MRVVVFALITTVVSLGAQSQNVQSAAARARADFERVDQASRPTFAEAQACVKSHEALVGVTRPEEMYLVHYRTGFCALFAAIAADEPAYFQRATREFTQAIVTWPKKGGEPSLGLRILPVVSRLERGRAAGSYPDTQRRLRELLTDHTCTASAVMSAEFCLAIVDAARTWIAWYSFERDNYPDALAAFSMHSAARVSKGSTAWQLMIQGQSALEQNRTPEAAEDLSRGLESWIWGRQTTTPDIVMLIGPNPDLPSAYMKLGHLQSALGKHSGAIAAYDHAVKERPNLSRALFLRAKSKEALGLTQVALADYSLAAELASIHNDTSWSPGDALFRRGALYFREKSYKAAQAEFSNALGRPVSEVSRADLTAWRLMAGVAAGECDSAGILESSARAASDLFPGIEAQRIIFECRLRDATTLEQLTTLEKSVATLAPQRSAEIRGRIGAQLANQGVAAEDKADSKAAVEAYLKALQYDPKNSKARFNLGAIYFDQKKFDQAEAQFRKLSESYPDDFEALYWVGESILAQSPAPARHAEACSLLKRAQSITDREKQQQFARAYTTAKCLPSERVSDN